MLYIDTYQRKHRQQVLDLLFRNYHVQRHLDWHTTEQWLELPGNVVLLAWQDDDLQGVVGFSAPLDHTTWLRVIAMADFSDTYAILSALWQTACARLQNEAVSVSMLVIEDWLPSYLRRLSFRYIEEVVTLTHTTPSQPDEQAYSFTIRPAHSADLHDMIRLDQTAFDAPWQLSDSELHNAKRLASSCTVALDEADAMLGYQLSTVYQRNGHLARLAVAPAAQGEGVGAALLHDLLRRFARRNLKRVTVNTQASNFRSQRLYQRFGFRHNGHSLPVWKFHLEAPTP